MVSPGILAGGGTITGNVSGSGTIDPGNSPGTLTINGNLTQPGALALEVNPPFNVAGTDYDQIVVSGSVDLSNTSISFAGGASAPAPQQLLTLIKNSGVAATTINGTSPAQGATVSINSASFHIYYNGGDDNDVVLVDASTPSIVYVDASFGAKTRAR